LKDSPDYEWFYKVDLQKATLRTLKGDKQIGFRKFEDLTNDYIRDLELAYEKEMVKTDGMSDEGNTIILIFLHYYYYGPV